MLGRSEPLNVWLYVRDLAVARAFYVERLGLTLWREEPREALHFGVGGAVLSIGVVTGADAVLHRGRLVFTVGAAIDEVCGELKGRGIVFEQPLADRPFGRSAMFRDPDGHELWVCRPSATETQFYRWQDARRTGRRPVVARRRPKLRRHVRPPPSYRPSHPRE